MTRKKSIVVLTLLAVFIVLMTVFAVVEFPIGLYDYTGYAKTIKLGLDLSGGVSAVFIVDEPETDDLQTRIDGTVQGLQNLLVSKGYTESVVSYANGKIRVEVPDIDDPEKVLELIGRPQSLEFRDGEGATAKVLIVGRDHIENAYVTYDDNGNYAVGLKFNSEGSKIFSEVTANYKTIYIYANNELYTTVSVNSAITNGQCIITSSKGYTYDEAYDFVTQIQSGTFSVSLVKDQIRTISATLGEGAIKSALIAAAIGIAIVFIFMAVVYRISGLAADIALFIYILLLLWFCSVLPWVQLTLPGIAGIVLSIGM
ncbi:MAG: preprotein translocase subunit SecD, partial [Christensenellales bacterium]